MSDDQSHLLAAIQTTVAAMAKQWLHRIQVARRKARDTATERGMLSSSIRYSLEGQAIASVAEVLIMEAEQMVMNHLKGAITSADLPSQDLLFEAVGRPIHALIESEIADLRSSPKRQAFPGSSMCEGAIHTAVANIEPALTVLESRIAAALQNRKAELTRELQTVEAQTPKNKPGSRPSDYPPDQLVQGIPPNIESPASRARRAFDALDLHPAIGRAAIKLFHDGHYANAVEDACKALDGLVQDKSGRPDLSGTDLMKTVFSAKNPTLRFSDLATETERSEQEGMMYLYAGAMLALRNPRAHKLIEDSHEQALEYIGFLNLLANSLGRSTLNKL